MNCSTLLVLLPEKATTPIAIKSSSHSNNINNKCSNIGTKVVIKQKQQHKQQCRNKTTKVVTNNSNKTEKLKQQMQQQNNEIVTKQHP